MLPDAIIKHIGQEYILNSMFFESIAECNAFLELHKLSILAFSKNSYDLDWHKQSVFFKDFADIFNLPSQTIHHFNITQQKSFWLLFYTQNEPKKGYWTLHPQNAGILLLDISLEFLEVFLDDLCFFADDNSQHLILLEKNFLYFFSIAHFGDLISNAAVSNQSQKIEIPALYSLVYSLKSEDFKRCIRECKNFDTHFFKNPEMNDVKYFLHRYTIACHENNDHEELKKLYAIAQEWDKVDNEIAFDWFYENMSMNYAYHPTQNNASILSYLGPKRLQTLYDTHDALIAIREKNLKD